MAGNGTGARTGGVAGRIRALLKETADLTTPELQQRARALGVLARAERELADLERAAGEAERAEAYIDDVAEGALRDQLKRRMVALEAEILARRNPGSAEG